MTTFKVDENGWPVREEQVFGGLLINPDAPIDFFPKTILDEASEIVTGARRKAYGHPENNFGRIAALWNNYLDLKPNGRESITPQDVALMMILMKVARLMESPDHRDSLVDLAGYAATIEMLWQQ